MATRTRRRGKSGHTDRRCSQRRRRYEAVLRPLGLWEKFAGMPRRAQELFCQRKFPDPVLEFDASFPTDDKHRSLRKLLEANFRSAFVEIDGAPVTVRDFFSVIAGLKFTVEHTRNAPGFPEACVAFMREAGPCLDRWYKFNLSETFAPLHSAVIVPLVAQSRLDGMLFTATLTQDSTASGKYVIRMVVGVSEAQVRRVRIDGSERPMYRVGTTNEWDGVHWLSWDRRQLDLPGTQQAYPVYVQSHALRQLHARINLPRMAPYLEYWLWRSLEAPHIVERHGENLQVEYRLMDQRVGYLVATPLQDLVVIRTFLFLTMEHTREARMLKQRLRLTRRDVDWLGLCELSAFTQSDLRMDPVLRPLLEACGCGHLFALGEREYSPQPRALAAEMKRYLLLAA